uniref:Uncharacterized protein n=1 Tax=Opuntia streptacantha TaxID=393608 RepID=A0A7C8ZKR3_OPUST
MVSIMLKLSGAYLQNPSILIFFSLTRGTKHRAHSFGIRPTSPPLFVENLTISEQAPACFPLPNAFPADGKLSLFFGNANSTSSPVLILRPLEVDIPEISAYPTNHHSPPLGTQSISLSLC